MRDGWKNWYSATVILMGLVLLTPEGFHQGAHRAPAASAEEGSVQLWKNLYTSLRRLERELDRRTADVSNLEEVDHEGVARPRSAWEKSVLSLRERVTLLLKQTKGKGKRAETLTATELDLYLGMLHGQLQAWSRDPLILGLPSEVDGELRGVRDAARALVGHYRLVLALGTPEDVFDGLFPLRTREVTFKSANHACSLLARPGDIILRKALLIDGRPDDDFSDHVLKAIRTVEAMKGADLELQYRHTELISRIESYNNIESVSYYPWYFMISKPKEERKPMFMLMNKSDPEYFSYRSKFAMFRLKKSRFEEETRARENALARAASRVLYHRMGTCADFVNWTFGNVISSSWNQLPLVREFVQLVYLPEAIQTPDDIADSPQTERICDVESSNLLFPARVSGKDWVNRAKADLASRDESIASHARGTWDFLRKNGVISADGTLLAEELVIQLKRF